MCNVVQRIPGNGGLFGNGRPSQKKADPDFPGSAVIRCVLLVAPEASASAVPPLPQVVSAESLSISHRKSLLEGGFRGGALHNGLRRFVGCMQRLCNGARTPYSPPRRRAPIPPANASRSPARVRATESVERPSRSKAGEQAGPKRVIPTVPDAGVSEAVRLLRVSVFPWVPLPAPGVPIPDETAAGNHQDTEPLLVRRVWLVEDRGVAGIRAGTRR
jgi:hypothetical protein